MCKCKRSDLAPSSAYRYYKCRCDRCKKWKRDAANRTNDKERARERSRIWRLNNIEKSRNNATEYQKRNPQKVLGWKLKKYNITVDDYKLLLQKQNSVCAICKSEARGMQHKNSRLCVDHDHSNNIVRGLLCGACNVALGHFNHSTELLEKGIEYLNNSPATGTRCKTTMKRNVYEA